MTLRVLDALFRPRSIAMVGATQEAGRIGTVVTQNLLHGGFLGPIMPVSRRFESIGGVLAYRNVASLPKTPDLAIVGTPPEPVPELIRALGEKGTRAAIVLTAGMQAAVDEAGRPMVQAMLEAAKPYGLRILGPNSLGMLIPGIGLNASFSHRAALPGRIAFVSQSGGMCTAVLDWARARGIGFSHVIALGECADVGFAEVLDYLGLAPANRAILLYMENLRHPRRFMSAARAAARNKPVLIIKAARVPEAFSELDVPPGTVAGADAVYDAAFRRAGMLRVFDIDELFAGVETLARASALRSDKLAIMTNGGGVAIMAVDALIEGRGSLVSLSPETRSQLAKVLPPCALSTNPVDILGDATVERYAEVLRILRGAKEVDTLLVMHVPTAVTSGLAIARAVIRVAGTTPGNILTCWVGEEAAAPVRHLFAEAGIPSYESPGMAVRGFLHRVHHQRNRELLLQTPRSIPEEFIPSMDVARKAVRKVLSDKRRIMADPEAKSVLAAYGVPTVSTGFARTPKRAQRLAETIGFPVAVKLISSDIENRLDVGGVVLDLDSAQAVREAAQRIEARLRRQFPEARLDGFSVQRMVQGPMAHELILGVTTDPVFGPVIIFGQGGSAADVIGDIAVALPPLNLHLARELMSRTRIYGVLQGYRGHKAADLDAISLTLVKISQLIVDIPEIAEVSINPLFALECGVLAVETRIRLQPDPPSAGERLAIRPYPQELEEDFVLAGGRLVRLRPIRPEDEPQHVGLFSRLRPEDIRLRFFGPLGKLTHSAMVRFTQIDYDREMAFVAVARSAGGEPETLGEVRAVFDPDNVTAEYSILVCSDIQGRGLGRKLLQKMIDYCRSRGTERLVGMVLRSNHVMLVLIGSLGFQIDQSTDDDQVYDTWLDLRDDRG